MTQPDNRAVYWLRARAYLTQLEAAPMPDDPDESAWRIADLASISASLAAVPYDVYLSACEIETAEQRERDKIRRQLFVMLADDDADHIPAERVQG